MLVTAALDAGWTVTELYVDDAQAHRHDLTALARRLPPEADVWSLPTDVLTRVGDAVTSQGVTAVVAQRPVTWPEAEADSLVLVLDEVADPGNVGTLIRAGVAAGAAAVVTVGGADPFSPKVVRASAGALFGLEVVDPRHDIPDDGDEAVSDPGTDLTVTLDRLSAAGFQLVGTVVGDAPAYDQVDLTGPTAIVVGNEAHGLAPEAFDQLHEVVTIPMAGPTESLNVAMAGTILAFEALRQRRTLA